MKMHVMFVLHSFFSIIGAAGVLVIGAALLCAGVTLLALTMIFFTEVVMPIMLGAVSVLAFVGLAALSTMSWGVFALLAPIVAIFAYAFWCGEREHRAAKRLAQPGVTAR